MQAVAFVDSYCSEGTADKAGNVPYFLDGNFSCFGVGSKVSYVRVFGKITLHQEPCFACLLMWLANSLRWHAYSSGATPSKGRNAVLHEIEAKRILSKAISHMLSST